MAGQRPKRHHRLVITVGRDLVETVENDFHPIEAEARNKLLRDENGGDSDLVPSREIKIGKNCFIGCNSIILKGTVLGMFKNIYWSATSGMEIAEIKHQIKATDKQFFIAEDLPRKVSGTSIEKEKKAGNLKIVWISRIAPKKNLKYAIEILKKTKSNVEFTIYGPAHTEEYWEECKQELGKLPDNVKWDWKGNLNSENVVETLKQYHVFLFPTLGENFGHVIQEALSAGCPCIISNQTPWQDFESKGVGYVFSLENKSAFVNAVEKYAVMEQSEFQKVTEKVHQYAIEVSNNKAKNTGYRDIFDMNWK